MTTLVLTVIGEDRPGLVSALADVVDEHGGSWGHSRMAEMEGTFAGIVTIEVPAEATAALREALLPLEGILTVTVRTADPAAAPDPGGAALHLDLVGHDRPGLVKEITAVLAAQQVSVEALDTRTRPAPQAGGDLFEARARLRAPQGADTGALRLALEELAAELQVDLGLSAEDTAATWE
jgi:glycine cleavage system regulatory protein